MKIDESTYGTLYDAMHYTNDDYHIKWFDKDALIGYIEQDDLLDMIEDLCYLIDKYKEELEELKNDVEDNYRRISPAEQYEISDRDFI